MANGQWFEAYDKLNKEHFFNNIPVGENKQNISQAIKHPENDSVIWIPRKNSYRKKFRSYCYGDEAANRLIRHVADNHNIELGHYETLPTFTKDLFGKGTYDKLYLYLDKEDLDKYELTKSVERHKGENYRHTLYNQFAIIADVWIADRKEDFRFLQDIQLQFLEEVFPGERVLIDSTKTNKINNTLEHIIGRFDNGGNPVGFILKEEFGESIWCKWRQYNDGMEVVSAITRNVDLHKYTLMFAFYAGEPKHASIVTELMKTQKGNKEHTNVLYFNKENPGNGVYIDNLKEALKVIYTTLNLDLK